MKIDNIFAIIFIVLILTLSYLPTTLSESDNNIQSDDDKSYTLTVQPINGTVTVKFNNNSYDVDYKRSFSIKEGTEVNLSASLLNTADWEVNGEMYAEEEKDISFIMDENKDVFVESTRSTRESLIVFFSLFISLVVISIFARLYIYFSTQSYRR